VRFWTATAHECFMLLREQLRPDPVRPLATPPVVAGLNTRSLMPLLLATGTRAVPDRGEELWPGPREQRVAHRRASVALCRGAGPQRVGARTRGHLCSDVGVCCGPRVPAAA
jgi:hypothetical protein